MNATYTVIFEGFPAKSAAALENMLREDLSAYLDRISMERVRVRMEPEPRTHIIQASDPKPRKKKKK